ncbi:MAG: ATP-dependent sacrificial sulfur transferase LarE [Pseudoflavonifractor sp.]
MTLQEFFAANPRAALAFSGGADSAFLLWAAQKYGCTVHAYYVHSAFQPDFELRDARRLAGELGIALTVLETDLLSVPHVAENPPDRCYHCKTALFTLLRNAAEADGYSLLLDGTNASDDPGDRPGMRALRALAVRSPLRECGMTKSEIRAASKAAGLFTWDKPAYACLATRVPCGTELTSEILRKIETAEDGLFGLGFTDFRVRLAGKNARLQFPAQQLARAVEQRGALLAILSPLFDGVMLDLEAR